MIAKSTRWPFGPIANPTSLVLPKSPLPVLSALVHPDGRRRTVGALNSSTAIKVDEPPADKSYYEVDGEYFVSTYKRILLRKKASA